MANNQPPLTHPATNPDGTCDDERCPCHEFARMPTTTTNSGDLDYWRRVTREANEKNGYDSPALRRTRSIVHHAEMVEEQKRRETCTECEHPNSVDLRGRCRETQRDPGGSMVYCGCKCVFPVEQTNERRADKPHAFISAQPGMKLCCHGDDAANLCKQPPEASVHSVYSAQPTFNDAWNSAPESMRRVTEIEAAELFYYAGRRDRETELLAEMNETLRGVVERIGAERLK